MNEIGINLDCAHLPGLTLRPNSDVVVTVGCGDAWPVFPDRRYLDLDLTNPAGEP